MDKKLEDITVILTEIKTDLKYHIKRTDQLEDLTMPMHRAYTGVKWSVGAILVISAILSAIAKIKGYL